MKILSFVNPSTDSSAKIGHDFSKKGVKKLNLLSKNSFNKKKFQLEPSYEESEPSRAGTL
jgi:hypothetical protein